MRTYPRFARLLALLAADEHSPLARAALVGLCVSIGSSIEDAERDAFEALGAQLRLSAASERDLRLAIQLHTLRMLSSVLVDAAPGDDRFHIGLLICQFILFTRTVESIRCTVRYAISVLYSILKNVCWLLYASLKLDARIGSFFR